MATLTFDLNGTLLDPGDQADALQQAVELAMAHTLAGDFRPFVELFEAVRGELPEAMPPFEDVAAGLDRLLRQGHRLAVITNSARETCERHLARAGLLEHFDQIAGADQVRAYKPDPRVYALIPGDWHVAAHWWDVLGAARAGRRTVYVNRGAPLPGTVAADLVVERLDDLDVR